MVHKVSSGCGRGNGADNRRILCASCGSQIRSVPVLPTEDKTRQARELLERWSKKKWSGETDEASESAPEPERQESNSPQFRFDEPHPDPAAISRTSQNPRGVSEPKRVSSKRASQTVSTPRQPVSGPSLTQRTHEPHRYSAPPPHFSGEPLLEEEPPLGNSSSKLQAFWGQLLAYAGVLALTVGAAFVLLGYFGGPEWQSYAPTGWLITTTGQMLLFLGVVTLVSGGMEHTTEEVARRIDRLGQRLIRIEWASQNHALKGPSLPAEQFLPGGVPQSETQSVPAHTVEN